MDKQVKEAPFQIYAESTPNPAAMKFVANKLLVKEGNTYEFTSPDETEASPLAESLFRFPFIEGVFITNNFISLTKNDTIDWNDIIIQIREFITDFIKKNGVVVHEDRAQENDKTVTPESTEDKITSDDDRKIVELLDEYVRPAVEGDGGAIVFDSYEDGVVRLIMKGACSGCPSSTMTLKAGIEGLLQKMMPEVKGVEAING